MTDLQAMIARQPQALRDVAALDLAPAVARLRDHGRIVLVGTGTSFHAAELGALALDDPAAGRRARAVESAHLHEFDPEEAAIVISHTGETAYARRARARLLAAGTAFVSITGPQAGWPEAIVTPVKEEAETYTVSYTAALAVLARLAAALPGGSSIDGPKAIERVADRVAQVVAAPGIDGIPLPERALALVGAGPWSITAREGALKLREGARMLCEGFDAERLLHGFAVPYGPADALVLVQPAEDPDGLVTALGEAARREGIAVAELTDTGADAGTEPSPNAGTDAEAGSESETGAGTLLSQIPMTVRLQCLAARAAAERGTDPDTVITGAWADPALWEVGAPPTSAQTT